jgi:hypothetical protein
MGPIYEFQFTYVLFFNKKSNIFFHVANIGPSHMVLFNSIRPMLTQHKARAKLRCLHFPFHLLEFFLGWETECYFDNILKLNIF